ncbi:aminotransferase class V-fold PLP-dependent enzyme [Marinimicrococcus flavescens]|uniref:Cysteine desulfurase n=1 Tax=Marinimicrococcus flavescens TaxID=3031815 RepID=A0AAP3UZ67_9PROT|nr:SufS family cysteine desulfurase [Marinimicrococcus flavescens]
MSKAVDALRRQFPIFASRPAPFHYLDNAATGQICRPAADALIHYETAARANVKRGVYRLADEASVAFHKARAEMAAYLGAERPEEVIFTSGTTLALNIAAHALAPRLHEGDEILLSELEHHSNIVPWQLVAQQKGAKVRAIPVTDEGRLDYDALERVVTDRTRIVAVSHCSNVTGAVTDVGRIKEAASAVGALLVVDGAQRAPHGPLDVRALGCDLYACSGHKMFAATGCGVLWGRRELLDELPPFLGGGEMIRQVSIERSTFAPPPHRFEAGTPPIGAALAMGAAAAWLSTLDWGALTEREMALTGRLLDGLSAIDGVRIQGPRGLQGRAGVVSFDVEDVHAHDVCQMLDADGVCLRGGHHCAQPLMDRFGLAATTRASIALYNDEADIDALLTGLEKTIARLR